MARAKKYNSFDNWKATLVWLVSVMSIMIILFLAIESKSLMPLKAVEIDIVQVAGQKSIVTEDIILKKMQAYLGFDLEAANIQDLNLVEVEQLIKSDDRVKSVEVYIDAAERIHIEIGQRVPVLRVMTDTANYYLDEEGNKIGKIKGRAIRVPIVTGEVSQYDESFLTEEYQGSLKEVYELALKLKKDDFLAALIEQIYVDERDEITLIPKLGDEDLVFGTMEDADDKLLDIKDFYLVGMPKSGWNKYHTLSFKYRNKDGVGLLFAEK